VAEREPKPDRAAHLEGAAQPAGTNRPAGSMRPDLRPDNVGPGESRESGGSDIPPGREPDYDSTSGPRRLLKRLILRYSPYALRDEWVNIGVLLFDEATGERRLRLIEDQEEFHRVRRLHPTADESVLRKLRDNLESMLAAEGRSPDWSKGGGTEWLTHFAKLQDAMSAAIQVTAPQGTRAADLDAELERLYALHVAVPREPGRTGLPGSRGSLRAYCSQVFKQARLWDRVDKGVRAEEFTFPGDPMRLDYSYRRNGTRGFVHTLSVTRAPADAKLLAYTAERIQGKGRFASEFAAVTDVALSADNERHRFVRDTLRDAGVEPVPLEGFAVWVAKLRPMLLQ
jgi:hypothetical protein